MPLLTNVLQPPLLTLLDSSSKPPLSPLFHTHIDRDLPDDSFVCTLQDDTDKPDEATQSIASTSKTRAYIPRTVPKGSTCHPVIHIQSPTIQTTYIQAGGSQARWKAKGKGKALEPLGVELPWLGLQIKRLGRREFAFEVGLVDGKGIEGRVRFSSFQTSPRLHLPMKHGSVPLLCVPLKLPALDSPSLLTLWLELSINLSTLLPLFQNHALLPSPHDSDDEAHVHIDRTLPPIGRKVRAYHARLASVGVSTGEMSPCPSSTFKSISYVRVYANCRVKRIWLGKEPTVDAIGGAGLRDEWGLFAS